MHGHQLALRHIQPLGKADRELLLVAQLQFLGDFDFDDERATAHAMLQATNGLLPYSLSTTELGERQEVQQRAADVADLILRGLLRRK